MNTAIQHLQASDPLLGNLISKSVIPTLYWSDSVFEDVVSCILDTQIRYRGNATRYKRLKALLNGEAITYQNLFTIGEQGFKTLKISQAKYNALVNLSNTWEIQNLDEFPWHETSNEDIKEILTSIKGIGNWTVDVILLYTLQRSNVVPYDDFQLKKAIKKLYGLENNSGIKREIQSIIASWSPYGSVASLYLIANYKLLQ